jgi:hypothetical protein
MRWKSLMKYQSKLKKYLSINYSLYLMSNGLESKVKILVNVQSVELKMLKVQRLERFSAKINAGLNNAKIRKNIFGLF